MMPYRLRCSFTAAALVALVASPALAEPGVLYVPTEDVMLTPVSTPGCTSQVNSGLGCAAGIDMQQVVPPYASAAALRDALAVALAPYDVHLATERPPEYLAYTMLLASDVPDPASQSFVCGAGAISCGARKRNGIARVFGPTQNCPVLDVPLAATYLFGRISGLEGVSDPLDAMHYVPDYTTGTGALVDACSTIVNQNGFDMGGMPIELPLECTSLDHPSCPAGQQNGHADLLEFYGPRVVDLEPPVLTNLSPGDGAVIPVGDDLVLDVDISDADPVVGGRWTVSSPVFEDLGFPGGVITFCTNDACDYGWDDASPLKATDSDWSLIFSGLPEGVYDITFEASDFHGNVAAPVMMTAFIGEGPPPGEDTGDLDTGDLDTGDLDTGGLDSGGGDSGQVFTTGPGLDDSGGLDAGPPPPADDTGTSGPEADDGGLVPHGCICASSGATESGGMAWWLVVAIALARPRG